MKNIYELELHEVGESDNYIIKRVPGGWLYVRKDPHLGSSNSMVFVPFNNEFVKKPVKKSQPVNLADNNYAAALRDIIRIYFGNVPETTIGALITDVQHLNSSKNIVKDYWDTHDEISLWEEISEYLSKGWTSTTEYHDALVKKVKNHITKIKASLKGDK